MRYARQTVLEDFGPEGQTALVQSRVLIVGLGGLGSPLALYLAAAGVGHLGLVDGDRVSLSNLQRQILFETTQIDRLKVDIAESQLHALNPEVVVKTYSAFLDSQNAEEIAAEYDILVDASDNLASKFLLNDLAVKLGKPLVYGSILRYEGQAAVFWAQRGPCYRCLFPEPPKQAIQNCAEAGVLGALAGVLGSVQALEVIKLCQLLKGHLPARLKPLIGSLWTFDARDMQSRILSLPKDPDCPVCAREPSTLLLPQLSLNCEVPQLTAREALLAQADYEWLDVREESEWASGHIPWAQSWPLSRLRAGAFPASPAKPWLLTCLSGKRSQEAAQLLREKGHAVYELHGGMSAWSGPRTEPA